MSKTHTAGTPRSVGKRAPTTPLSLVNNSNKRQLAAKGALSEPHSSIADMIPVSSKSYQKEMLDSRFELWVLEQKLATESDTRAFLEIERKALMGRI